MESLAEKWSGFGAIVVSLSFVVGLLFKLLIGSHKAERDGWLAANTALQAQVAQAFKQLGEVYEKRIEENRMNARELLDLSVKAVASDQAVKEELGDLKEQLKALQEDGADEHEFVQGLLNRLATKERVAA